MSTVTLLRFWNDPGFMDGAVEVPAYDRLNVLPTPTFTIGTLGEDPVSAEINPSKGRMFSELKIKKSYTECLNLSYLEMTVEFNNNTTRKFYGFIDGVDMVSDTADYPAVLIRWHVDLWRTYMGQAGYGYGLVTRRSRSLNDPIQHVPYRYRKVTDRAYNLVAPDIVGGNCYWAIINYTHENDNHTATESRVIVCPVAKTPNTVYYMKLSAESTARRVPTLNQWVLGEYDEIFGLAPSSISSVFLSPIPPLRLNSGTGTVDDPFVVVGSSVSPEPHTTTYSGVDAVGVAYVRSGSVELTDGSTISFSSWPDRIVYAGRGCSRSEGSILTSTIFTIRVNGTTALTSTGSNENPGPVLSAEPVDQYVRDILGDAVFNTLVNGDTIVFSNIYGLYRTAGLSQSVYDTPLPSGGLRTLEWELDVSDAVPNSTVLTYNNGTFGDYWVVANGTLSTSSVAITTTTEATTTADYGVVEATYQTNDYMYLYTKTNKFAEFSGSLSVPVTTTDTEQFILTDLDGSVVGNVPWGLTLKDYTYRVVVSATSAYAQFRFDGLNSSAEGLQFSIPLPPLDITSNSWSEYTYSGQRDYDIEQRKIARDRALVEGLGGALAGGAQGAMLGGLKESQTFLPSTATIMNASMFGLLGAGASVAGSLINYGSATHYNDRLQSASDMLQAKQIDSIVTGGNGCDWLYHGRPYQLRSLVPDDYSLTRYDENVALNGIEVSEPERVCSTLIFNARGPLRIENLVVGGPIPAEAKQYIKQKFNDGVRLI